MTAPSAPLRSFSALVDARAESASPSMLSGLYESVSEFFVVTTQGSDIGSTIEQFEPSEGNEWLRPGYAAAMAYRPGSSAAEDAPFTLAVYVEGDVTRYRFARFEDATRAGRLWAVGLI